MNPSLISRSLVKDDLSAVRSLCIASFPIEYPDTWYDDVVSGSLTSIGLFDVDRLVGVIVAEYKYLLHCNPEDRSILSDDVGPVVYILSLAVSSDARRQGIASRLLKEVLQVYSKEQGYPDRELPRAFFLHVLSTNAAAISFYLRHGFILHDTLPNYYRLRDSFGDGLTYVLYVNGGRKAYSWSDLCRLASSFLCSPLKRMIKFDNSHCS